MSSLGVKKSEKKRRDCKRLYHINLSSHFKEKGSPKFVEELICTNFGVLREDREALGGESFTNISDVLESAGLNLAAIPRRRVTARSFHEGGLQTRCEETWFVYVYTAEPDSFLVYASSRLYGIVRFCEVVRKNSVCLSETGVIFPVGAFACRSDAEQFKIWLQKFKSYFYGSSDDFIEFYVWLRSFASEVADVWTAYVKELIGSIKENIENGTATKEERLLYTKLRSKFRRSTPTSCLGSGEGSVGERSDADNHGRTLIRSHERRGDNLPLETIQSTIKGLFASGNSRDRVPSSGDVSVGDEEIRGGGSLASETH